MQEINEKLDHLTNQTTLLSCWAKSSIEDKIFWKESSNFIHNYTLDGGWTFGNYNNYGPMAISTTLNGCGVGKVHFGPYFHECTPPKITQQIDGKGIGEISDGRGSEFLLTTTEIGPKIQKLSKYGVAIKFKTFQIVECSSKCD